MGYWADTGRTAVIGEPPSDLVRYYAALQAGIAELLKRAQPGVAVSELFDAGVQTVRESGIPHYQRHHVGHAIGLEMYEPPVLANAQSSDIHRFGESDIRLEPGMVINIELPYYELGLGGLQIEDTLVIRPDGHEVLTTASRDLYRIGQ
jgi:Xaa-Pro aminopeptidase